MRLRGFGQVLDSDRDIAGTLPAIGDAPADIVVRHRRPAPLGEVPLYTACADGLVFAPPRVGSYRCRPGAIDVVPCPAADPAAVAGLLIATALPAVLWLQRRYVLHAAAVRLPGCAHAIAFAGPSGVGKSTLAAALVARGASLLADDSVAVDETLLASGLPGGMFEVAASAHDGTPERRFVALPVERTVPAAPLAALFVLSRGQGACTRLAPLAALSQLLRHRHRPAVPALLGRLGEGLATCGVLSTRLPVYLWPRRQGAAGLQEADWTMLRATIA